MSKTSRRRCGNLTVSFKPPKAALILEVEKCLKELKDFKKEVPFMEI